MDEHIFFMKKAYKQALIALSKDEVPIGAIIVKDGEVIARGHNLRETKQNALQHAETIAIDKACRKLNTWRLDDCTLYTTMEPCIMCSGVIIQSRIKTVVYGASDTRWLALSQLLESNPSLNHFPTVIRGIMQDECASIVKEYFKNKRMKNREE